MRQAASGQDEAAVCRVFQGLGAGAVERPAGHHRRLRAAAWADRGAPGPRRVHRRQLPADRELQHPCARHVHARRCSLTPLLYVWHGTRQGFRHGGRQWSGARQHTLRVAYMHGTLSRCELRTHHVRAAQAACGHTIRHCACQRPEGVPCGACCACPPLRAVAPRGLQQLASACISDGQVCTRRLGGCVLKLVMGAQHRGVVTTRGGHLPRLLHPCHCRRAARLCCASHSVVCAARRVAKRLGERGGGLRCVEVCPPCHYPAAVVLCRTSPWCEREI